MSAELQAVRLLEKERCGSETATFRFSKPVGYVFRPGQHFTLTLDTSSGQESKHFSHAEAPTDPYIELTTRLSGSHFKNALWAMEPGTGASIAGPKGRLTLPDRASMVAFLIGGVGVTPARSMLRDAARRGAGMDAVVFYGNRGSECVPYRAELEGLADAEPLVRLILVFEHPPHDWSGETGFVTAEMVREHATPAAERMFVVAGPPAMVDAMERVLDELSIPREQRLVERFSGYR